jgi:formylglycine-generating enzyme required for sulfatase activity
MEVGGGAVADPSGKLRSAYRFYSPATTRFLSYGFRLVQGR